MRSFFNLFAFDARWNGANGIGRFSTEIESRLIFRLRYSHDASPVALSSALKLGIWVRQSGAIGLYSPGYIPPVFATTPFVFTLHDLNHIDVPHNSSLAKRQFYRAVIRPAIHRAYRIVTVSEYSKSRIVDWSSCSPDKVHVACNGVSHAFYPQVAPMTPGYPYLFCCSNRKGHKNEFRLLEAFKASGLHRHIKLVFSGSVDDATSRKLQTLNLNSCVVFTGRLTEDDLASWYRGAVATVFPSLYEGFGLPLIESMACGTPVLTSNTSSLPEIGGDAALYVDPMSVESIADGLRRMVDDSVLRTSLSALGHARAAHYTWDRAASAVSGALEGMVND